jgi:hypothetical protein
MSRQASEFSDESTVDRPVVSYSLMFVFGELLRDEQWEKLVDKIGEQGVMG